LGSADSTRVGVASPRARVARGAPCLVARPGIVNLLESYTVCPCRNFARNY